MNLRELPWDFVSPISTSLMNNFASFGLYRSNRRWMERMSNTAITRAAADMRNAGINPILAHGSSASSPSPSLPTFTDPTEQAFLVSRSKMELKAMQASINKTNKETEAIDQSMKTNYLKLLSPFLFSTALRMSSKGLLKSLGTFGYIPSLIHMYLSQAYGSNYYKKVGSKFLNKNPSRFAQTYVRQFMDLP